jgi:hypothetical protein
MRLYDRDYTTLTEREQAEWESVRRKEVVGRVGTLSVRRSLFREYPKAARHFMHMFPNNYLDTVELADKVRLHRVLGSFRQLVSSSSVRELDILGFIRRERAYFIVASLMKAYFHFGHHQAYMFPEFQLGTSYKADYLLVGKSSGGWHFVFVELEAVTGKITLAGGELGEVFRKGLSQVADWNAWLEERYGSLSETFDKHRRSDMALPREFSHLDTSRINFVVIAGRRDDFSEKTYQIRRRSQAQSATLVLHYDNLLDSAERVIGELTY